MHGFVSINSECVQVEGGGGCNFSFGVSVPAALKKNFFFSSWKSLRV